MLALLVTSCAAPPPALPASESGTPAPVYPPPTSPADTGPIVTSSAPGCTQTGIDLGMCAPDFALSTAAGAEVALGDWRGDLVLVHSAALW